MNGFIFTGIPKYHGRNRYFSLTKFNVADAGNYGKKSKGMAAKETVSISGRLGLL